MAVVDAVAAVTVLLESDVADKTGVCGLTNSATASPTIRITSNQGNFFSAFFMATPLSFSRTCGTVSRVSGITIALFRGITISR